MNAQNNSRPECSRIAIIIFLAVVHLALVLTAFLVLFDKWQWQYPSARIAGLLGLAALGSSTAFFTACQSAMDKSATKRTRFQGRWAYKRLLGVFMKPRIWRLCFACSLAFLSAAGHICSYSWRANYRWIDGSEQILNGYWSTCSIISNDSASNRP